MAATIVDARAPAFPTRLLATLSVVLLSLQTRMSVDAFTSPITSTTSTTARPPPAAPVGALHLARKYVVIGGNLDGINPDQEEDTYSMSKKERRRRERERGEANFKSGNYTKKTEKTVAVNYDKLEEKVTKERTLLPREARETTTNTRKTSRVEKKLSVKAARMQKQRTAGGNVDSTLQTTVPQSPEKQPIQIRVAKRGNKTVTLVQGMTLPFKDRKVLLKEMKGKLGGGGALVEGVLELQGSHADKILEMLKSKGYSEAKVVGGNA